MKVFRDLSFGLVSAILSSVIVIGALSFALMQGGGYSGLQLGLTSTYTSTATRSIDAQNGVLIQTSTPTILDTPTPQCPLPSKWTTYTVQPGDTLDSLARTFHIKVTVFRDKNCLESDTLPPGSFLYVPRQSDAATPTRPPSPTITAWVCHKPSGWISYVIQPKDTLTKLSQAYGISVYELQTANCILDVDYIYSGQVILVPNVPTHTIQASLTHVSQKPTSTPRPNTRVPSPTSPVHTPTPTTQPVSSQTPTAITTNSVPNNTSTITSTPK